MIRAKLTRADTEMGIEHCAEKLRGVGIPMRVSHSYGLEYDPSFYDRPGEKVEWRSNPLAYETEFRYHPPADPDVIDVEARVVDDTKALTTIKQLQHDQ